jgi:hypothetical protein
MPCIKHMACPISDKVVSETMNMAFEDVMKALSPQMEVSVDATSSLSPDDSPANTDESDSESRSTNSDETVSESDSSKQVKVAAAAAATGITFDFGASNVVKLDILAMEIHARYFSKGHGRLPGAKTVPTPRANEAVVFEDLFTTGLRMPPHPVLAG